MTKLFPIALAALALATPALAEKTVLNTLPKDVQKRIAEVREGCPTESTTSGDEGLVSFTVSGREGVLIDELALCQGGCFKGTNCATGYTHDITIYLRAGKTWKKELATDVTEPIFVSTEPVEPYKFRALVVSVHAWGDEADKTELKCYPRNKNNSTAWKHEKCDYVIKWDGTRFVPKPL